MYVVLILRLSVLYVAHCHVRYGVRICCSLLFVLLIFVVVLPLLSLVRRCCRCVVVVRVGDVAVDVAVGGGGGDGGDVAGAVDTGGLNEYSVVVVRYDVTGVEIGDDIDVAVVVMIVVVSSYVAVFVVWCWRCWWWSCCC